jgi:16S rRNA (guanine1516-N2)-methyltransferase
MRDTKQNNSLSTDDQNTVILIEDTGSIFASEQSQLLAKKLALQVHVIPANKKKHAFNQAQWQLVFTSRGLALIDFAATNLQYRQQHGGGRNEAIAKAIGIKGKQSVNVLDCTAGMGTDSFIMASVGAQVTLVERSPIIGALLDNALMRGLQADDPVCIKVCERMALIQQDAITYLSDNSAVTAQIDVVYLDPMFPHKKKSALVKKEMRAFQMLLGPDQDSELLLSAAINFAPKRIVVKRPASAPPLENTKGLVPSMAIGSKKHRFDVYLLH